MGTIYSSIPEALHSFIEDQQLFFVATSPLSATGRVNLSPKGYRDCFKILDAQRIIYLDYTGSGAETIAHLRENGRITIMFAAFTGEPNIVRLYGEGRVIESHDPDFAAFSAHFELPVGFRAIIEVRVDRVSESCGYGVPFFEFKGERRRLTQGWEKRGREGVEAYQSQKNARSLDGLPALRSMTPEEEQGSS